MDFYQLVEINDPDFEDELIPVPSSYISSRMGVTFVKYKPKPHYKNDILKITQLVQNKLPAPEDWEEYACTVKQQAISFKEARLLVYSHLQKKIASLEIPNEQTSPIANDSSVNEKDTEQSIVQDENMANTSEKFNVDVPFDDNIEILLDTDECEDVSDELNGIKRVTKQILLPSSSTNINDAKNKPPNLPRKIALKDVVLKPNISKSRLQNKQKHSKADGSILPNLDGLPPMTERNLNDMSQTVQPEELPHENLTKKKHVGYSGHRVPMQRTDSDTEASTSKREINIDNRAIEQLLKTSTTWVVNTVTKYVNVKLFEQQCSIDEIKTKIIEREEGYVDIDREMLMKSDIERLHRVTLPFRTVEDFSLFDVGLQNNTNDWRANLHKYIHCMVLPSNEIRDNLRIIIRDFMSRRLITNYTASRQTGTKLVFAKTAFAILLSENVIKIYKKALGKDQKDYDNSDVLREIGEVFNSSRDWKDEEDDEDKDMNNDKPKNKRRRLKD